MDNGRKQEVGSSRNRLKAGRGLRVEEREELAPFMCCFGRGAGNKNEKSCHKEESDWTI